MNIQLTSEANLFGLSHQQMKDRLFQLRNAKKSTHWIKADLTVEKRGLVENIFWIFLRLFPNFRNKIFRTNLTTAKRNLKAIKSDIKDYQLELLIKECSDVINYKKDKSYSKHTIIQSATQGLSSGPNWKPSAIRYVQQLQESAPNGITFNAAKLSHMTMGGNCTAITLDFLDQYFHRRPSSVDSEPNSLEKRLKDITRSYRWGGNWVAMRTRQAAFNCIETLQSHHEHHVYTKVEAMARFHDLTVVETSQAFDLEKNLKNKLKTIVNCMVDGVYFLRVIEPADNEKLEIKGHSMVFIRSSEGDFFFDPNKGLEKIEEEAHERLFDHLKHNYKRFGITQATFLRIMPKE